MDNNVIKTLGNGYKFLVKQFLEVEESLITSPHSSIVKGRILAESISKEVATLENLNYLNTLSQNDRLKELSRQTDVEKWILDIFHNIRNIGNNAAHGKVEGELQNALHIHRNLYKILSWFVEIYIDPNIKADDYEEPCLQKSSDKEIEDIKNEIKKIKLNNNYSNESGKNEKPTVIKGRDCLIDELSKLRQSSKEAVESIKEFSDFKKYMHVIRNVQEELEEIVKKANESDKSQLILVCGSVGDGKSHIISYLQNEYPEIIANFKIDNDATESLLPNQTSMEKLNMLLDNFSDEKIKKNNDKFLLAINLGTLNNFIDSEYGERFLTLKRFVKEKKILDTSIESNGFDEESNIQFINFSDYHLFTLKNGIVRSDYIKTLIGKVTDKNENNLFYKSYKGNCLECENKAKCPIKANYEFLGEEEIKDSIVDLLVQAIIKEKIIVSTRALLNFIYELIISRTYIDINSPVFKKKIGKLKIKEYIKSLTPNILFEHRELSFIFKALSEIDPVNIRNEEVDEFIVKFNNSENIMKFFESNINYPKGYMEKFKEEEFKGESKRYLLKLFIRSYYMCGYGDLFSLKDTVYEEYIRNLYYWNKGEKNNLRNMYSKIKEGIMKWNGETSKNNINIFIGKNQTKYKISEELELKINISNLHKNDDVELNKFISFIQVGYKTDKDINLQFINVDYALYSLLNKVINGYRPNKKDRNRFINFIEYMKKLENLGSQKEQIFITEKNRDENRKYKLEYDEEFDQYRFLEI